MGVVVCGVLAGCGEGEVPTPDEQARANIAAVRGVPQDGPILGAGSGPTLMVFARVDDLRLADFVSEALPRLVRARQVGDRVGPGRLKVRLQAIAVGGDDDADSMPLAQLLQAAGLQDHLWELLGSVVVRYPGVIDDEFTAAVLRDVPALRRLVVTRYARSPRVKAAITRANGLARSLDLPEFAYVIEHPDGSLEVLRPRTPGGLLRDLADPSGRESHRVAAAPPLGSAKPATRTERERHPFPYPLRQGAAGPAVEELQKGLPDLKVTGVYDDATREAVAAFQRDHDLDADGVTGEQTWAAIFARPAVAP